MCQLLGLRVGLARFRGHWLSGQIHFRPIGGHSLASGAPAGVVSAHSANPTRGLIGASEVSMRPLRRRGFRRAVWTVAVAGVLVSQVAFVSASQADRTPSSGQPTDAELGQDKLDAAAASIASVAAADDAYYEAGIDLDKQTVVVFRKGGDTGLAQSTKALYREKALGATVEFRNALFTTSEEAAILDTVEAAYDRGGVFTEGRPGRSRCLQPPRHRQGLAESGTRWRRAVRGG